jgi:hypothetical protein
MRLTSTASTLRNVLTAFSLAAGLVSVAAPASSAVQGTGWLRLAHLSPNTPAVDVYLYSFGNSRARVVLRHVKYGTVSPYLRARAGVYTVAMRSAGAAASSAPVLSTAVNVRAGDAYTVAGMGPAKGLRLKVLSERLTTPKGHAMIRVIQASKREHMVTVRAGSDLIGKDLRFATATGYHAVPHGTLAVRAAGQTEHAASTLTLRSGTIHTLVVLDQPGQLKIDNLEDAAGSKVVSPIAPDTGFGGTAPGPGSPAVAWLAFVTAGMLIAASGLIRFRRSRRPVPSMR